MLLFVSFLFFLVHFFVSLLNFFIIPQFYKEIMSMINVPIKTSGSNNNSLVEENFCSYYESWLKQLELHLQQLVLGRQPNYDTVVATLTAHHKAYYTAKWAAAHEDILAFFSPRWSSPLETAYTWVTGWKPSTAFRLVDFLRRTRAPLTSLAQLSEVQAQRIAELGAKMKQEEQKVERELERQQVAMGDLKMVGVARLASKVDVNEPNRVDELVGSAVKGLLGGLEKVMKMADFVRLKTLKGILDVLTPRQGVDFLAVFAMLQIQIRKLGIQRAANNDNIGTNNIISTLASS